MKKKNYCFVFLYAIGSILIVAGHCYNGSINLAFDFFTPYSFHLALFVFSSGYFYKDKYESNILNYIWKKFNKFIIPMYIINFFCGLFVFISKRFGFTIGESFNLYNLLISPLNDGHQFLYNMCFWFVVPLFMVEVFNVIFRKISKIVKLKNEYIYALIYFFMGIFSLYLVKLGYNSGNMLILLRLLYFLPYYGLGILYNKKLEKHDKLKNDKYFFLIFTIQLIAITYNKEVPLYTPSWLQFNNHIILPYIESILGIAFWLRISKILENYTKKSKLINSIANNSYAIMAYQFIGFFSVKLFFAILSKYTVYFSNFNVNAFKTDIWYYYLPMGISQWLIIYLVAGIFIPILINKFISKCKNILKEKILNIRKDYS